MNNNAVDLHVHSNKSDGTLTPTELLKYAAEKGLKAMALTDHDTVDGLDEILKAAEETENAPEIAPGVELSTDLDGKDIHVVGLFIDYKNKDFEDYLDRFIVLREKRNKDMCDALREGLQMDITIEKLMTAFPGSVMTRAHFARYMLDRGYIKSMDEAFDRWIGDGKPYYIPRNKVTPEEGVEVILKAGGLPILAHPILYRYSKERLEKLVSSLKDAGLVGIESIYSTYSVSDTRYIKELAKRFDLLESGGSDFHGSNKKTIDLMTGTGKLHVPYKVYEKLKERAGK